jgi:MarR family transcriptional regulator, lower aerobic nicotinate degradation pathway regulator
MTARGDASQARRTPKDLDDSLGFNVYRCALLLRRELTRALARYEMTPEQWHVLAVLYEAQAPVSQAEIVGVLLKDKPTVTRILQRMERDGWIRRSEDATDGRVVRVRTTAAGARLHRLVPGLLTCQLEGLFEAFTSAELSRLISQLKRIRRQLGD